MPVNYGGAFRGGVAGASIGTSILPGWGTAIGGGIGALAGLFSKSESEERRQRIQALMAAIERNRQARLGEFRRQMREYTTGLRQSATRKGERLARSMGREDLAQSYVLPQAQAVATAGTRALRSGIADISREFDIQKYNVERDVAAEPIEPGVVDYLEQLAPAISSFKATMGTMTLPVGQQETPAIRPYTGKINEMPFEREPMWKIPRSGRLPYRVGYNYEPRMRF